MLENLPEVLISGDFTLFFFFSGMSYCLQKEVQQCVQSPDFKNSTGPWKQFETVGYVTKKTSEKEQKTTELL